MQSILIKNATILTLDHRNRIIRDGAVFIENGEIVEVADTNYSNRSFSFVEYTLDAKGNVLLPGLINCHTHSFQTLLRGLGDDKSLFEWIREVNGRISNKIDKAMAEAAAKLSSLEMILTGVTTVIDHFTVSTSDEVIESVAKAFHLSGLRGFVARGIRVNTRDSESLGVILGHGNEEDEINSTERLVKRWNDIERVRICPGPASTFSATSNLLKMAGDISRKYQVPFHIHVAERPESVKISIMNNGFPEVKYLHSLGVLNSLTQIVHGVWLNDEEISILSRFGCSVIHCPVSNMYLASGVAPVSKFISSGVNVALGTDGPASNNSHDMFEVMKTATLLCKVNTGDPSSMTAIKALSMATIGGARATGLIKAIGTIEKGKRADLILVDPRRPHSMPVHSPVSSLVYSCNRNNVLAVICDGAPLMVEGKVLGMDEEEVMAGAEKAAEALLPDKV